MKKPQLLILMFFATLIMVCVFTDNHDHYRNCLGRGMNKCKKQLCHWQGAIQDKMPF